MKGSLQDLARRYEAGEPIEDLSRDFGVSPRQLYRECARMGVSRERRRPNYTTPEGIALSKAKSAAFIDWPPLTLSIEDMLDRINRDGGFPVRLVVDGQVVEVRRAA